MRRLQGRKDGPVYIIYRPFLPRPQHRVGMDYASGKSSLKGKLSTPSERK